jgi:hypothetical protein
MARTPAQIAAYAASSPEVPAATVPVAAVPVTPTPLTVEQKITYLHRRVARLERNSGMMVHPHPNDASLETERANQAAADAAKLAEATRKAAADKAAADAAKVVALNANASSTEPIIPGVDDENPDGLTVNPPGL